MHRFSHPTVLLQGIFSIQEFGVKNTQSTSLQGGRRGNRVALKLPWPKGCGAHRKNRSRHTECVCDLWWLAQKQVVGLDTCSIWGCAQRPRKERPFWKHLVESDAYVLGASKATVTYAAHSSQQLREQQAPSLKHLPQPSGSYSCYTLECSPYLNFCVAVLILVPPSVPTHGAKVY